MTRSFHPTPGADNSRYLQSGFLIHDRDTKFTGRSPPPRRSCTSQGGYDWATVGLAVPFRSGCHRCSHYVFLGYGSKNPLKEEKPMGKGTEDRAEGTLDKAKGKVKETAGEATGDQDLEREGRMDQANGSGKRAVGSVKDAAGKVKEDVKDAGDKLTE
jgi:uncharacterized protein YjbJ (UPF0337 family)